MSERVTVRREAVDWLKEHYPALCEKSGLCERIDRKLYTRTFMDDQSPTKARDMAKPEFERADPVALAAFDSRTKACTMNCGPTLGDPRTPKERRFLCPDCLNLTPPTFGECAKALLNQMRDLRNELPDGEERSALNAACDRMDVAVSKLCDAALKNVNEKLQG